MADKKDTTAPETAAAATTQEPKSKFNLEDLKDKLPHVNADNVADTAIGTAIGVGAVVVLTWLINAIRGK